MEEIFGLDMNVLMVIMLISFGLIVVAIGVLALLNKIILKVGLRNIPRRPAQTTLIVIGLMLSTLIISSALGTGDTLSFSIKNNVITRLGEVDEILTANQGLSFGATGSNPYFPISRFDELRADLSDFDEIDGFAPMIAERAPVVNPSTRQSVGSMNITAVEASLANDFGSITTLSGATVSIDQLQGNEVFLNQRAADELLAKPGDELELFLKDRTVGLLVKDVARKGGLAGDDETIVISLAQGQRFFEKPDQINSIIVSNRGDSRGGVKLSDEVTDLLRLRLTNDDVAQELFEFLSVPTRIDAIRDFAEEEGGSRGDDLMEVADLLEQPEVSDGLVTLLADDIVSGQVQLAVVGEADTLVESLALFTMFSRLKKLNVQDIKHDLLEFADEAASGITSLFVIFGMFSILAGVMLIFLIFVMLAAERKPEMGIARAVGMRRQHLVQSFLYEGMAYDLLSALIGAVIGIGVGFTIVTIMAGIFASDDDGFELIRHYEPRSFVIAYSMGVVLTFITVFFSAYRASRLNIVSAIRDLPDTFASTSNEHRLHIIGRALIRPLTFLIRAIKALVKFNIGRFIGNLLLAVLWVFIWPVDIVISVVRASSNALSQGWLTTVLGILLTVLGVSSGQTALYTMGVSITIIGVGLMLRWTFSRRALSTTSQNGITGAAIGLVSLFWLLSGVVQGQTLMILLALAVIGFEALRQIAMRKDTALTDIESRNAFTFIGLSMILFWGSPFDSLDYIVPELESGIEMFFLSGIAMVTAAVWVIVYNADLITGGVTAVFGRYSRLRPSLKTAVAYSLNSRIRTGLTLAMLSLVIFTLIVMSVLTTSFGSVLDDIEPLTGGWDILGTVSFNNPIEDIERELPSRLGAEADNIDAIGGYTSLPIEARQIDAETQTWRTYNLRGADQAFLENTEHDFAMFAPEYAENKDEIWKALREDPTLAVIDAFAVPQRNGGQFSFGGPTFRLEGFFLEDDELPPTQIEVREPRTGKIATLRVIGVMEVLADQFANPPIINIISSKVVLDQISEEPLPITTYRFKVEPGADAKVIARAIEANFLQNGMETLVLKEEVEEARAQNLAFNRLFQGFMASGLLVGIAALGVISSRAVVERRQQIGVLKAIGYRQGMILASFLMESSFIALLGIFLGVALGTLLSYNLVNSIGEDIPGLRFTVPWLQISIIVGIAYAFSLLTTFLPARQAARIYPAQALRYE